MYPLAPLAITARARSRPPSYESTTTGTPGAKSARVCRTSAAAWRLTSDRETIIKQIDADGSLFSNSSTEEYVSTRIGEADCTLCLIHSRKNLRLSITAKRPQPMRRCALRLPAVCSRQRYHRIDQYRSSVPQCLHGLLT